MLAEPLLFTGSQLLLNPDHLANPLEEELPLETQVFSMSRLLSLSFGVFEKKRKPLLLETTFQLLDKFSNFGLGSCWLHIAGFLLNKYSNRGEALVGFILPDSRN